MIFMFMLVLLLISLILIVLNYLIGLKWGVSREKSSIFECGFDPSADSRLPFSMHFFLVALIFLVFDVEISLLIPLPYVWSAVGMYSYSWMALSVLFLLLGGALVEWIEGSLDWYV